ncbi:MAG: S24/S26 family peptidase, partial [Endomicrobiia bacterium]|nr:S24/S26 family peptidase [Endomicrobiia bacterium]
KTTGGCMRPTIKSGDVLLVEATENPRAGDCVLFESGGRRFLHRALYVNSDGALLADDAGFTPAVFVPKNFIFGVCRVFPSGAAGVAYSFCMRVFFRLGRAIKHILK